MAATIWYENDGDLSVLSGKKVAILGYGSQGHAHALNLRDSGVDVVVGLRPSSKSVEFAKEQGLEVKSIEDAVAEADVVMILLPDQYQAKVYKEQVEPNLKPGAALAFAHGFNIHYGYIKPSEDHPVFMVAPKGPGHIVRREYAAGRGVPVVVAVEQDPRGDAWGITLAYAKALGALRAGAIKTTFTEETETDLFGEQDVLMGGVNHLVEAGFEVLTEAGYQPEIAYFEVCHELKMLVDLMNEGGLNKARWSCSDTAQYGDFTSTVVDESTKDRMRYQLKRIQDGSFAKEFMDDQAAGAPKFKELQEKFPGTTARPPMPTRPSPSTARSPARRCSDRNSRREFHRSLHARRQRKSCGLPNRRSQPCVTESPAGNFTGHCTRGDRAIRV